MYAIGIYAFEGAEQMFLGKAGPHPELKRVLDYCGEPGDLVVKFSNDEELIIGFWDEEIDGWQIGEE